MVSAMTTARTKRGFTLVELLVVLAIIATLLTLVVPRYFRDVERSKETVLRQNLQTTRHAIDTFHADNARYPHNLQELVDKHYLKEVPLDPITDSRDTWVITPSPNREPGLYDIHSGAKGEGQDGKPFSSW